MYDNNQPCRVYFSVRNISHIVDFDEIKSSVKSYCMHYTSPRIIGVIKGHHSIADSNPRYVLFQNILFPEYLWFGYIMPRAVSIVLRNHILGLSKEGISQKVIAIRMDARLRLSTEFTENMSQI